MAGASIGERFVGFYWTFSAPLVGFRHLSDDVDEASRQSRTIRYQRERIRLHVEEAHGRLVGEVAFMEVSPDRGTEFIAEPVRRAQAIARREGATMLVVEFHAAAGWREHYRLWNTLNDGDVPVETVPPDPVPLDGVPFDPQAHFGAWRDFTRTAAAERRRTAEEALAEAFARVPDRRGRWAGIADMLNAEGVPTITGTAWTAENVRKAVGRKGLAAAGEAAD